MLRHSFDLTLFVLALAMAFVTALVWLLFDFGLTLVWPWFGFGLALLWLCVGFALALLWLCFGFALTWVWFLGECREVCSTWSTHFLALGPVSQPIGSINIEEALGVLSLQMKHRSNTGWIIVVGQFFAR